MISSLSLSDFGTHDESRYPELWEGCVGAWAPCLGPTGLRLHDLSRYRNWGTLTNMNAATDWVVSGGRYALDFDGSNDLVNCGNAASVTGPLTVEVWCRRTGAVAPNSSGLAGRYVGNPTADRQYLLYISVTDSSYNFIVSSNGTSVVNLAASATSVLNTLDHVVGVYVPSQRLEIFVNGRSVGLTTTSVPSSLFSSAAPFRLATQFFSTDDSRTAFNGQIFQTTVWNRYLNSNEIKTLSTRIGIAYERRKRRSVYVPRTSSLRRKILTGQV